MARFFIQIVCAVASTVLAAQEGHPLVGSWHGDRGTGPQRRTDVTLVIEFRQLSLRLNVGEIGVCQSDFGFHIIKRYQ